VASSSDERLAQRLKALTEARSRLPRRPCSGATVPAEDFHRLESLLGSSSTFEVRLGDEEVPGLEATPGVPGPAGVGPEAGTPAPIALILRSRTKRLSFIGPLHTLLASTALVAVALGTLVSYAIARTVDAAAPGHHRHHGEMAATGDLTRKAPCPLRAKWQERGRAASSPTISPVMTEAIAGYPALKPASGIGWPPSGRLSTVTRTRYGIPDDHQDGHSHAAAHEIPEVERGEALRDIDGEVVRLTASCRDVLDFARPIQYDYASVDLTRSASGGDPRHGRASREGGAPEAGSELPSVMTDGDRLHGVRSSTS